MSGKRPRFPKNAAVPPIRRMGGTALQHKRGPSLGTVLFHRSLCSPQWQTGRRPLRVQHKECPAADRRTQNMASADPYGRSAEASVAGRRGRRSLREVAATTQASGAQRSVCAADAKNRRKRSRNHPKGPSNAGQSLSRPPGDSSLYTREPFPGGGTGNMGTVGSPQQRAAEVVGPYGFSGHPPSRSGAVSGRDGSCQAQLGHLLLDAFLAGAHGLDGPLQQGVQLPA